MAEKVSSIMATEIVTLAPSDSMADVSDVFDRKHIHHIPILESNKLVGIISKSNFLFFRHDVVGEKAIREEMDRLRSVKIGDVMPRTVRTLDANDSISTAADIFISNYFHGLPVMQNEKLVGMVTPIDIIKYFLNNTK